MIILLPFITITCVCFCSLFHLPTYLPTYLSIYLSIYLSDLYRAFPQICIISKALYKHSLNWKIYRQGNYLTVITFFLKFLLDRGPFCGATGTICFGLRMTLRMSFTVRVDQSSPALFFLLTVITLFETCVLKWILNNPKVFASLLLW